MNRYIKKNNIVIVGLAKNASQSIKKLAFDYNWEIHEELNDEEFEKFVDLYNPNTKIYFPLRDVIDRAKSEFLQKINDEFLDQDKIKDITEYINTQIQDRTFYPQHHYFDNCAMKFFMKNIFCNDSWNGCEYYFFDLNNLNSKFVEYIGIDVIIDNKNKLTERPNKIILNELISKSTFKNKYCDYNFIRSANSIQYPIFEIIKKSKQWLNLDG